MSPETPSPQQDDSEFNNPLTDEIKEPEFGSEEFLENAATDIDSHLDKIAGKYPEVDSAITEFRIATDAQKVGSAEYNTAFESLINKLTAYDSTIPGNPFLPFIGDLQKDLMTFKML